MLKDTVSGLFISRLFASCWWMLFWGMDLAMHVSGKFEMGLAVSTVAVCIGLLGPFGTLCHDILAYLGQLSKLGDFCQAVTPNEVYFDRCVQICF